MLSSCYPCRDEPFYIYEELRRRKKKAIVCDCYQPYTMDAAMAIFRKRWTSRVDAMWQLSTARRGSQGATVVATSLCSATRIN